MGIQETIRTIYALGVFDAQLEKRCEKKWFPKVGSPELLKLNWVSGLSLLENWYGTWFIVLRNHAFHHFSIDFDAVSTENGLKNHCFCNVLQLVSLYYKVGGVFTDSWLETMVSGMFCSYFHLILTLIWKNLHGLAKNHQKHMGFSSISPYFDLILTLIWPYFEVIFGNLGVCKNHGFYHIFHHFTIDFDAVSTENVFLQFVAAIFTLFWRWFERIFMV